MVLLLCTACTAVVDVRSQRLGGDAESEIIRSVTTDYSLHHEGGDVTNVFDMSAWTLRGIPAATSWEGPGSVWLSSA